MKKTFLAFALAASLSAVAPAAAQRLGGEVLGGFNVSSMTHYDSQFGFRAGGLVNYQFRPGPGSVYVNGGLMLSMEGAHKAAGGVKTTINEFYFMIPVHVGYRYSLNPTIAVFGDAGPYFGIGAFGSTSVKSNGIKVSHDSFGDAGPVKRFDFGLGFRLGVEIANRVPFAFGWDFGLVNVHKVSPSMRNSCFSFTVGYKF